MRATRTIAAIMAALGLVPANASPITSTLSFNASQASNATTSTNACASVSALAAKASAMVEVNSTTPVNVTAKVGALPAHIPAQLAYDCLQSVPINATQATRLVDSLGQFLAFHSSTTYLKNPPSSYLMPAIDVYATLDQIRANVTGGSYRGEWDFSVALANLIAQMHDDHMSWNSDAFLSGFNWTRPVALASVSPDGVTLPKVYVYDDLPMLGSNNLTTSNMTTTVSAVAQIDGLEVTDFINQAALWETGEDPDTNYNRVLLNLASYGGGDVNGSFQNPTFYPGANTTVQFENGTTLVYNNTAIVAEDWGHVDSGEAFYAQYCSPKVAPPDNDPSGPGPVEPDMQGYPPTLVRHSTNLVAGFFLDGNYSDTAVLQTNGFSTTTSNLTGKNGGQEFQLVVAEFLAKSAAAGKTKLIVDIQSNGGGDEDPEYDMFKQLFPNNTPYEASEWRAQPVLRAIDQTMDELRKTLLNNATAQALAASNASITARRIQKHHRAHVANVADFLTNTMFNFPQELSENGTNFASFDQFYGPYSFANDTFTAPAQTNLSTGAGGRESGMEITGYGRPAQPQVFATQNVVVLTNGDCISMCHSFVEQTRTELGMNFVTVGGRPQYGQMQAAGGTRGGSVIAFRDINDTISGLQSLLQPTPDKLEEFNAAVSDFDIYALERTGGGTSSINVRNTIRHGDASHVPTQFHYDPAQCRMFYTAVDMFDMTNLWRRVAAVAFHGQPLCSPPSDPGQGPVAGVTMASGPRNVPYGDGRSLPFGGNFASANSSVAAFTNSSPAASTSNNTDVDASD